MKKTLMLLACLTACTPVTRDHSARVVRIAEAPSAPDAAPTIAKLRAEGPRALGRLLQQYDAMEPGRERDALGDTIDQVAAQRYATVSGLYWHTDLEAAKAAAKKSRRPILSLRMLGRLDEELSCANSRFFRTVLYANAELSQYLRDHFELHWSSERPVPRVTIDYGDGRKLVRTVTGNSAHYVLDAAGRPLDVLPGLYAPAIFRAELERAVALDARAARLRGAERSAAIVEHHQKRRAERMAAWQQIGQVAIVDDSPVTPAQRLARAQRATMSKSGIEVPDLKRIDLGSDPGKLDDGLALWSEIGGRLFAWQGPVLDPQSRELIVSLLSAPAAGEPPLDDLAKNAILTRLDSTLVADTALNEMRLRTQITDHLLQNPEIDFVALNAWVYASAFHTPADDRWLGLLPRSHFLALPGDGVVASQ
jgi:hypothetical protein